MNLNRRVTRMEARRAPETKRVAITAMPHREMTDAERESWKAAERERRGLGPDDMLIILTSPRKDADGRWIHDEP